MNSPHLAVPFLRRPCLHSLISSVVTVGVAIQFGNFTDTWPKQELLPHFSKASAAIFAVKHVKYGWHDRTPCLIIAVGTTRTTAFVGVQAVS
jgi:hypothetical protein